LKVWGSSPSPPILENPGALHGVSGLLGNHQIDYSDIPESTNSELRRSKWVGRPSTGRVKLLIAIRIDPNLLAKLRKLAKKQNKPYQTLIHQLLERAAYGAQS
jgi:uncharacterized protein (DUF4415 family)